MKYPKTLGRIEAVWNKLGGEEGVDRFLRGELEVVVKTVVAVVFALWKTLTVGAHQSVADIRTTLGSVSMRLGDYAADILSKVPLGVSGETSVSFVRVKVKDLGFTKQTKLRDILTAGQKQGLKFCLPEDSVALRLGYPDQPMNEVVWLAMKPVEGSNGYWRVLCVYRSDFGLWLDTICHTLDSLWDPEGEFVFRK